MILKTPVEDKCTELKLKSCDRLAQGIVLYVDGDKTAGYSELKAGIAANSEEPLKLKALASGLKLLQKAPGVGPYVAAMAPVVELVDDAATEALQRKRSKRDEDKEDKDDDTPWSPPVESPKRTAKKEPTPKEDPPEPPQPAGLPVRGGSVGPVRTGTVTWSQKGLERCPLLAAAPELQSHTSALCALVLDGPLLVTDLQTSGSCPHGIMIFSGEPERPRWFVNVPASYRLEMHGASLAVQAGSPLRVAALVDAATPPTSSPGCAVTWSARRPLPARFQPRRPHCSGAKPLGGTSRFGMPFPTWPHIR